MCNDSLPVKHEIPVIPSLRGFYGEAWQLADQAHASAIAAHDLLQRLHSPPSDILAVARLAEDSARLLRVVLERAQTRAALRAVELEAPSPRQVVDAEFMPAAWGGDR